MAKKVQMSTVELVVAKLEAKGWTVDDIELSNGWVTVWANAYGEKIEGASLKQAQANKWADSVMDMNPVQADEDMSIEEWEAQYGHVTDDDVAQALAPVVEEVEPVVVEEESIPGVNNLCLGCNVVLPNRKLRYCPECQKRVDAGEPRDSFGAFLSTPLVLQGIKVEFDPVTLEATIDLRNVEPVAEAAPETPKEEVMETKLFVCVNECGTVVDHEGDLCPDCAKAFEAVAAKEDALYEQYLSVREPYFDENPDLGMVFEAMLYRRWLYVRYQTDYTNGTSVIRDRKWLPSHVYQASSTGGVCVVAFDVCKKNGREERSIKTFRIDKIRGAHLGEIAPPAKGDAVTLYPAAYEVRRSMPQRVSNPGKYLATGNWATTPLPQVLTQ